MSYIRFYLGFYFLRVFLARSDEDRSIIEIISNNNESHSDEVKPDESKNTQQSKKRKKEKQKLFLVHGFQSEPPVHGK